VSDVLTFRLLGTTSPARIGDVVDALAAQLADARVPEAAREARDIVAAVADEPRFWPTLNRDRTLDAELCARAWTAATRRARGAPFAYAVGRAAFRHLTLDVDERVLIPRQETEMLVECILERERHGVAADVGTGSGAIALALAAEGRFDRIIATDVSREALDVARANVARLSPILRTPVELRLGSMLVPLRGERVTLLASNPPYISHDEAAVLPESVRDWEPPIALYSAQNGMAMIAALIREAASVLEPGGLLALEVDATRASVAAELAMSDGRYHDVQIERDMAGRDRVLLAKRT
jgi:release factor glutamine methyltransferase